MQRLFLVVLSFLLPSAVPAVADDQLCDGILDGETVVTQLAEEHVSADGTLLPGIRWTPIFEATPVYEKRSLRDLKGHVLFLLDVKSDGDIRDLEFVSANPKKLYTKRAKQHAKLLHFFPLKVDGKGVPVKQVCYAMIFD